MQWWTDRPRRSRAHISEHPQSRWLGKTQIGIGFAAGRFPFSNTPYGIKPRNAWEQVAWPIVRGKIFQEAVEIFLRFIKGEVFSSKQVTDQVLQRSDFRTDEHWQQTLDAYGENQNQIPLPSRWEFDQVGVIPLEAPLENLWLTIGAHDAATQDFANTFYPCGVFNLSFTPGPQIEATHQRLMKTFHPDGGPWKRTYMPRTVLVFIEDGPGLSTAQKDQKARETATKATENYWCAIEGTIDPARIQQGVDNALVGSPETVLEQVKSRFHPEDRLMLWFDFNNHDNAGVKANMTCFMERVAAQL